MDENRAVVTGIGVVAPGVTGTKAFWELLADGRTATRRISLFEVTEEYRSRIAAEASFDPLAEGLTAEQAGIWDRAKQMAVIAGREALRDSGLAVQPAPPERVGVSLGSAVGSTMRLEENFQRLSSNGAKWMVDMAHEPALYGYMVPSSMAAELAWECSAEGPVSMISNGCTSGLDAIGEGARLIREGSADVVVAGATDAPISPITVASFDAIRATSPDNDDPEHASRPFSADRNGFVLGEGAAVFVLENLDRARARGAGCYGEIAGFACRSNAFHMTGLRPDGREMAEAIRVALAQARVAPEDIDYVNAHGSGTKQNDRHETMAFKRSLGAHAYSVPVSSIKSMIGHSLGAIGALEIAACLLAMCHQTVPPTANLRVPDPECDLDYVPVTAREWPIDSVLSVGSGFGGFQTAMVLSNTR